jgi:hypothetical protein
MNIPIPPLEELINIPLRHLILGNLKIIDDEVVERRVVETSMFMLPLPCCAKCENKLKKKQSGMSEPIISRCQRT